MRCDCNDSDAASTPAYLHRDHRLELMLEHMMQVHELSAIGASDALVAGALEELMSSVPKVETGPDKPDQWAHEEQVTSIAAFLAGECPQ